MRNKLLNGRIEALARAIARALAKRSLQSIQEMPYPEMLDHPTLNRATRKDVHIGSRIPVYADNLVPLPEDGPGAIGPGGRRDHRCTLSQTHRRHRLAQYRRDNLRNGRDD